jgi:hypothetical protein
MSDIFSLSPPSGRQSIPPIAANHAALMHVIFAHKKRLAFRGLGFEQISLNFCTDEAGVRSARLAGFCLHGGRQITLPKGRFSIRQRSVGRLGQQEGLSHDWLDSVGLKQLARLWVQNTRSQARQVT